MSKSEIFVRKSPQITSIIEKIPEIFVDNRDDDKVYYNLSSKSLFDIFIEQEMIYNELFAEGDHYKRSKDFENIYRDDKN